MPESQLSTAVPTGSAVQESESVMKLRKLMEAVSDDIRFVFMQYAIEIIHEI